MNEDKFTTQEIMEKYCSPERIAKIEKEAEKQVSEIKKHGGVKPSLDRKIPSYGIIEQTIED